MICHRLGHVLPPKKTMFPTETSITTQLICDHSEGFLKKGLIVLGRQCWDMPLSTWHWAGSHPSPHRSQGDVCTGYRALGETTSHSRLSGSGVTQVTHMYIHTSLRAHTCMYLHTQTHTHDWREAFDPTYFQITKDSVLCLFFFSPLTQFGFFFKIFLNDSLVCVCLFLKFQFPIDFNLWFFRNKQISHTTSPLLPVVLGYPHLYTGDLAKQPCSPSFWEWESFVPLAFVWSCSFWKQVGRNTMGMHLLLPFSRALRHPNGLYTGFIFFTYFELSASQSPKQWSGPCAEMGQPGGHPCCCLFISLLRVSLSPSCWPGIQVHIYFHHAGHICNHRGSWSGVEDAVVTHSSQDLRPPLSMASCTSCPHWDPWSDHEPPLEQDPLLWDGLRSFRTVVPKLEYPRPHPEKTEYMTLNSFSISIHVHWRESHTPHTWILALPPLSIETFVIL